MFGQILWIAIAYLIGSIPFGLLIGKHMCAIDPRTGGSHNVGATNVARLCGTKYGVATLACDLLKGAVPVAIALTISHSTLFISLVALAALGGHIKSVFLNFTGGKAVATSIGVFLPLAFGPLLISCAICAAIIWRSGYVSMGSLSLVTILPITLLLSGCWTYLPLALVIMTLVYWTHRENITRLARGEEKPWQKKHHKESE